MYSLCLDCGATNVRAMVVDEQGVIVGKASQPNATLPGEENPEFHIWDADRIFRQISECAVKALEGLNAEQVTAATITTFGVDGALVDEAGNLLYPVISWKCPRTAEVMKNIGKYISQEELNRISGVGAFAFNTIYKLVWLKENRPELLEKAHAWLFISNLLAYKLTGIMGTVWSVILATENGLANVPPIYARAARTMGAGSAYTLLFVTLPASAPFIVSGMKQGWAFSWRSLMSAEIFIPILTGLGLGQLLHFGRELNSMEQVMGIMFVIILIGLLSDKLIFSPLEQAIYRRWGTNLA